MAVSFGRRAFAQWKWRGGPEMKTTFKAVADALSDKSDEVKAIILPPCNTAMDKARNLAPIASTETGGPRGTAEYPPGTLKNAIYATTGRKNMRGIMMKVGRKQAPYGAWVEYGTSKMEARPYFRPSILQMQGTYLADIAPGCQRLIEKIAKDNAFHEST
jgi:HK97 gp10 family phage protein